jgi:dTDP-4-dehydrorhamnose 3,5-epimerase
MPFTFQSTALVDAIVIDPKSFADDRGMFRETFKIADFADAGLPTRFAQANLSSSRKGVLRGLHFQTDPMAQGKLVSCVAGAIYDVAVDIRHGSPTFGQWIGEELSMANGRMLWIPAGFAHGFCALEDNSALSYSVTEVFSGAHDGGIAWNDPELGIEWPISDPLLSDKDQELPRLADGDPGFQYVMK